jgi:energy-coupling factor transporter ATP-binding protein EcfA2
MTSFGLLQLMADLRGLRVDAHRTQHIYFLLRALGLFARRHEAARGFTESERRRVAVAMALVGFPRAVMLDAPTAGLDHVTRRFLWTAIACAPPQCSWVFSTDHAVDAGFVATHAALMAGGTLRWTGALDDCERQLGRGRIALTLYANGYGCGGGERRGVGGSREFIASGPLPGGGYDEASGLVHAGAAASTDDAAVARAVDAILDRYPYTETVLATHHARVLLVSNAARNAPAAPVPLTMRHVLEFVTDLQRNLAAPVSAAAAVPSVSSPAVDIFAPPSTRPEAASPVSLAALDVVATESGGVGIDAPPPFRFTLSVAALHEAVLDLTPSAPLGHSFFLPLDVA